MPEVFFNGPCGRIEGQFAKSDNPDAPTALVLHPHPLYGGTMNNKVVFNVYKTLYENGFSVLRINFRGVGKSEGEYDNGVGEMMDAATALDWLQINHGGSRVNLIAGFSFGSWVAMQLIMRRPEITNFIAVSPPVSNSSYDFSILSPCPIPGLIVQGDNDSVVDEEAVHDLATRLSKQKNIEVVYKMIPGADHFFRNNIDDLRADIDQYLKTIFAEKESKIVDFKAKKQKSTSTPSKQIFLD